MFLHWRANLADQNKQQPLKINIRVKYHTVLSVWNKPLIDTCQHCSTNWANQALSSLENAGFQNKGFVCKGFLPLPLPPLSFFGSCFISRAAKTKNPVPRSFFAPKPNGNACYAGYGLCSIISLCFKVIIINWQTKTQGKTKFKPRIKLLTEPQHIQNKTRMGSRTHSLRLFSSQYCMFNNLTNQNAPIDHTLPHLVLQIYVK